MRDNIVLIGLMGAGKTTVARAIAQGWAMNFVDFDEEIEKKEGLCVSEIFEKFGEKYFRELEKEIIKKYKTCENFIISTGGGIVKDVENIEKLRKIGKIVYLKASPQALFGRIQDDNKRPLLNGKDALRELSALYEQRRANYALADFTVNTEDKSLKEIMKEIYEKLER